MTQLEVLERIDEQSRRALLTGENADIRALLEMYDQALADITTAVEGTFSQMQSGTGEREDYLKWKLGREQRLMNLIRGRLDGLRANFSAALRDGMLSAYTQQGIWDAYALDMASPPSIGVDTRALTPHAADSVVNTPWEGPMFSHRVWAITDDMAREIQNQLGQSVLLGEGIDDAVRRIKNLQVMDGNVPPRYAIERLARTEILKASDRARQLLYAENSDIVTAELIVATLDSRTDEGCGELDEKVLGGEEASDIIDEWDFNERPPFHPNCRCSTIPRMKTWGQLLGVGKAPSDLEDFSSVDRVVRDPETGKSVIAPVQSFEDWTAMKGLVGR